jgi:hypothetical protein
MGEHRSDFSSFFAFTFVGSGKTSHFHRDKGVFLMIEPPCSGPSPLFTTVPPSGEMLAPSSVKPGSQSTSSSSLPECWYRQVSKTPDLPNGIWAIPVIGLTLLAAISTSSPSVSRVSLISLSPRLGDRLRSS